jgi:hypothetical protein
MTGIRGFRRWLINQTLRQKQEQQKRRKNNHVVIRSKNGNCVISWIERLLQTSLQDYRKVSIWRVLIPYLLNIRRLSPEEAQDITRRWLNKCNQLKRLDFNPDHRIKSAVYSSKDFLPISCDKLKVENEGFYKLLQERGVLIK